MKEGDLNIRGVRKRSMKEYDQNNIYIYEVLK